MFDGVSWWVELNVWDAVLRCYFLDVEWLLLGILELEFDLKKPMGGGSVWKAHFAYVPPASCAGAVDDGRGVCKIQIFCQETTDLLVWNDVECGLQSFTSKSNWGSSGLHDIHRRRFAGSYGCRGAQGAGVSEIPRIPTGSTGGKWGNQRANDSVLSIIRKSEMMIPIEQMSKNMIDSENGDCMDISHMDTIYGYLNKNGGFP